MAKKHQIVISSKSGRSAAAKSWRADNKESLNRQVSQAGYLSEAKMIARSDRYSRNLADRNKFRAQTSPSLTAIEQLRLRATANANNTEAGQLAIYAKDVARKPKLIFTIIKEWLVSGDAIYEVWQGNHWRSARGVGLNFFIPTDEEITEFKSKFSQFL